MPLQRGIQFAHNPFFLRTTPTAIENGCQDKEERARNGKAKANKTVGRGIITVTHVPYKENDSRDNDQKGNQDAYNLGTASREEQQTEEHTSELQSLTNLVCRLLL